MTENLEFNMQEAYEEIKQKAQASGINNKEAYDALVEDFIEEKIEVGELDKDEDTQAMISDLKATWPTYEENMEVEVDLNE